MYICKYLQAFVSKFDSILLNPFVPNTPFLYSPPQPKTLRFSDVFMGYRKGTLGTNGLNIGEVSLHSNVT